MVRLTDRPDMTLDVYSGRKTTMQQQQQILTNKVDLVTLACENQIALNTADSRYLKHRYRKVPSYIK